MNHHYSTLLTTIGDDAQCMWCGVWWIGCLNSGELPMLEPPLNVRVPTSRLPSSHLRSAAGTSPSTATSACTCATRRSSRSSSSSSIARADGVDDGNEGGAAELRKRRGVKVTHPCVELRLAGLVEVAMNELIACATWTCPSVDCGSKAIKSHLAGVVRAHDSFESPPDHALNHLQDIIVVLAFVVASLGGSHLASRV